MVSGGDDNESDGADDPGKPAYWLRGLAEASARFEGFEATPLDNYAALYQSVLAHYRFRCAMTTTEGTAEHPNGGLEVCAIRPRDAGGELRVGNFLCLSKAADRAFMAGHLTVGRGYEIIVDLSRVDPELLEALNPSGKLALPEDPKAAPDPEALAFHRSRVFLAGLGD